MKAHICLGTIIAIYAMVTIGMIFSMMGGRIWY